MLLKHPEHNTGQAWESKNTHMSGGWSRCHRTGDYIYATHSSAPEPHRLKNTHSRGLRPLPPTPRKNCRRVVSGDASETVREVTRGHPKRPGSAPETCGRDCPIPTGVGFPDLSIILGALQIPTGVAFPAPGRAAGLPCRICSNTAVDWEGPWTYWYSL